MHPTLHRTGLFDCYMALYSLYFVDDCMRNSNFGIGVLHVLTYFLCDVISLLAQDFIVSFDRAYKDKNERGVYKK